MSWLRKLGETYLESNLRKQTFSADPSIKSPYVAILFAEHMLSDQQQALAFAEKLTTQTTFEPSLLGFMCKKLEPSVSFSFAHYSLTDLNLNGKPWNKKVDLFTQRPYYAVFNLDHTNQVSLHFLCHRISAVHKIAIQPNLPKLYDVVLNPETPKESNLIQQELIDLFKIICD